MIPELTHAEVLRTVRHEVETIGNISLAARHWNVSPKLLAAILRGERNIGPKLMKALRLRRVRFVVYRFEKL